MVYIYNNKKKEMVNPLYAYNDNLFKFLLKLLFLIKTKLSFTL